MNLGNDYTILNRNRFFMHLNFNLNSKISFFILCSRRSKYTLTIDSKQLNLLLYLLPFVNSPWVVFYWDHTPFLHHPIEMISDSDIKFSKLLKWRSNFSRMKLSILQIKQKNENHFFIMYNKIPKSGNKELVMKRINLHLSAGSLLLLSSAYNIQSIAIMFTMMYIFCQYTSWIIIVNI